MIGSVRLFESERVDIGVKGDLLVDVHSLRAFEKCPLVSLFVFVMVVYFKVYAAQYFGHIDPFCADPEIILEEIAVAVRTADTHGNSADVDVCAVSHLTCGNCTSCKAQELFLYVLRNALVVSVLDIMAVYRKCGQTSLCMESHCRREINCTGTLCSVKSPYSLDSKRIEIHCLAAVTPAGSY